MGGGGGLGFFAGTAGAKDGVAPFSGGTLVAAAAQLGTVTDAGGAAELETQRAPAQEWNRESTIEHLQRNTRARPGNNCGRAVSQAIEAGGVSLNRGLNPTRTQANPSGSASGYGPVLENAGFRAVPADTTPQAGDVVVFPQSRGHEHGHAAMFDGSVWRSDFRQRDIYGSGNRRYDRTPYTIYRRP